MQLNKIPTTVVTGFLGSGKTTLISSLIKQAEGKRVAVIVNEFGELDIDADLLRSCPLSCDDSSRAEGNGGQNLAFDAAEDGIYELANGCICCTVEEEFLPVMKQLVERRDTIDYILIETSGLALPKPLVQAFNWPGIKEYCTVDAVITVIDGPAVASGRYAHDADKIQAQRLADASLDHDPSLKELLEDQLSAADLVVVSKNDLLDTAQRSLVEKMVSHYVPDEVKTAYINHGEAKLNAIIGLDAATEERIDGIHSHHDHHHQQGEHHEHAHDQFDSFVVQIGEVDADKIQAAIHSVLSEFNIFRVKGFAALPGKPMRQVLQAVGKRLDAYFDRPWRSDEPRKTSLVFIGKDIEKAVIQSVLEGALV
ncbi:MAG: cobalamin biosynthesis protein CobW [Gammaproteobacteria bacterium]|nr:MAG: cobalamin biosynthesis protein CobW [Gammaproteobacteria bacterium]